MKYIIILFITLNCLTMLASQIPEVKVSNTEQLMKAIAISETDQIIQFNPGIYEFTTSPIIDPFSGNGLEHLKDIEVTTGLHIKERSLEIIGADRDSVIIKTNSGYGIFIENCTRLVLKDLTITGGIRDQDGEATCAAVVVRNSNVEITGCIIRDNQGDFEKTIAGIGGIIGREGALLNIHHNEIHDNSWDGVALYRGARAIIHDNLIYNGRGAGIGITWNAEADIYRNVIHHYWKGVGSFGTSRVAVKNNLIRDLRGWGIIATGKSIMNCRNNFIYNIGNVGIAGWSEEAKIDICNNVIINCGIEEQWVAPLVGIWMNCKEGNYLIEKNLLSNNKEADFAFGYKPAEDQKKFSFLEERNLFENGFNFKIESNKVELLVTKWGKDQILVKDPLNPELQELIGSKTAYGIYGGSYGDWDWNPDEKPFNNK